MKILMCASEIVPFAKTGGLADVVGALPCFLEKLGVEVRLVMPRYKIVNSCQLSVVSLNKDIDVATVGKNVTVYLIKNDGYFNRAQLYGDKDGDYPDNLERFAFFCRRTLDLLKEIDYKPDCIHCHDWQTGLIPVYLKNIYRRDNFYKNIKTLFTVHNLAYQGIFPREEYFKLGLEPSLFNPRELEFYGKINLLKGALVDSGFINTVSPSYAKEIQTRELGCGLEGVLEERSKDVFGILNGIDYETWNPENDKYIYSSFTARDLSGKLVNKARLKEDCGLKAGRTALLGFVGRLAEPKGMSLIAAAVEELIKSENIQLIALGLGEEKYHKVLNSLAKKYPGNVCAHIKFDNGLARKIYAASDIFLMPSRYEPCGLGQIIALRYGAVPVVFKTGGLKDTISEKNGFVFEDYTARDFSSALKKAILVYKDQERWERLVRQALSCQFSWDDSAKKYIELYERLI